MAKIKVETLADRQRAAMESIRSQRNQKLAQSDWVEAPDAPLSAATRASWRAYRQLLRDWPDRVTDPLNPPPWPDDPATVGVADAYLILVPGGYVGGGTVYGDPAVATEWFSRVKAAAAKRVQLNAAAAMHAIRLELAEAQEAEALGVPPPRGRSTTELNDLIQQGQAAFKTVFQNIEGASDISGVNTVLNNSLQGGLGWMVGGDWSPYPDTCPWAVG